MIVISSRENECNVCSFFIYLSGIIRIVGKISANKSKLPTTEIHIETPKVIFDHQNNVHGDKNENGGGATGHDPLILQLKQTAFPLIGPNYKLIIRDGDEEFVVNQTVPMPKCLYNGKLKGNDSVNVAISTCDQNKIVSLTFHSGSQRDRKFKKVLAKKLVKSN